jgi:hypothetical protein
MGNILKHIFYVKIYKIVFVERSWKWHHLCMLFYHYKKSKWSFKSIPVCKNPPIWLPSINSRLNFFDQWHEHSVIETTLSANVCGFNFSHWSRYRERKWLQNLKSFSYDWLKWYPYNGNWKRNFSYRNLSGWWFVPWFRFIKLHFLLNLQMSN